MEGKIAIVDLGSNSARLVVMRVFADGAYKMVDQAKEMVRLSEGMGPEMILKPKAIQRAMEALKRFRLMIETHRPEQVHLLATAAVRNAANKQDFLDKVQAETGLSFQVVSGEEEAYYAYLGVINTIDIENCLIVDVGGGSTELVLVENREMKESISFPFGAVLLSEQFLDGGKNVGTRLKKLEEHIATQFQSLPWLEKAQGLPLVGLGGTARTFAKMDKHRIGFPLMSLHNYQMTRQEVWTAYEKVVKADLSQRKDLEGVGKERADIIVGGMVLFKILMELLKGQHMIVSGNGLREGAFFQNYLQTADQRHQQANGYSQNTGAGPQSDLVASVLDHSVENIMKNYDANQEHCRHVERLALSIFDQTLELHGLGAEARKLLSVAARLHDIGNYVDYYNHHCHGFYLILNSNLYGLRNRERVICAFLVGLHRDAELKRDWHEFQMLISQEDFLMIQKASLFLNMAEKLDRWENGRVSQVDCFVGEDALQMIIKSKDSVQLAAAALSGCRKEVKKTFGKQLIVV